jgi:hypothetical protein
MSIIALSARVYPTFIQPLRVEAAGRSSDAVPDDAAPAVFRVTEEVTTDLPPSEPGDVVEALLDALDDAELEALEELDTEDIEVLARQLQLRGVRRQHPGGFLRVEV